MFIAFNGSQHITVDGKGRIVIPTIFRDDLKKLSDGVLNISEDIYESFLNIVTLDEWEKTKDMFKEQSTNAEYRELQRLFLGPNKECKMDDNGRVLIPKELRQAAEIEKDAILIGCADRLELWSQTNWTKHKESVKTRIKGEKYSAILDKLTG